MDYKFVYDSLIPSISWSIIVNCAYLAHVVLNIPAEFPVIFLPILVGFYFSLFSDDLKRGFMSLLLFVLLLFVLMYVTLSLPVYFGVFYEASYVDLFNFVLFLSIIRSLILVVFFAFISYITTIFIKGM